MTDKLKEIEKILLWVDSITEFDINKMADMIRNESFSFSGTLSQYEVVTPLRKSVETYLEGEYDATFVKLKEFILYLIEYEKYDYSTESIRKYAALLNSSYDYIDICNKYINSWKAQKLEEIKKDFHFEKDSLDINAYDCLRIKNSIDNRYFHLYQYKNNGAVKKTTKLKLANTIIASSNIEDLITNAGNDDTWGITVGLYIEEKIDLSYFVITFSLNGNVFILTDRPIYENPDQINRLRGGGRRFSEDRENNLDFLPYILIDKVIENRKNTTSISDNPNSEVWSFPLNEYFSSNLYFIIGYTIEKIISDYSVQQLISSIGNAHLLAASNTDMDNNSYFSQTNIDILDKLVNEIYGENSKSLVVLNSQLAETFGINTQLMTVEEYEKNTQYLAHKLVVENHEKEKWGDKYDVDGMETYHEYSLQKNQLLTIFKEKTKDLEKYLFAGELVYLHDIDNPYLFSGFNSNKLERASVHLINGCYQYGSLVPQNTKYYVSCSSGDGYNVKKEDRYRSFNFLRYTEIITILGIRRDELPPLFRDFISHNYLPYLGNCILDNVKPEHKALADDFVSRQNANGFHVSFPYCGFCHKRLYNQYKIADKAVIVISSKQNKVFEILPIDEFRGKYNLKK